MDTGCDQLHATSTDGVGVIVFDNPTKHNATTSEMLAALERACHAFADDPEVRVVVVRGAGDRAFVSGADVSKLGSGEMSSSGGSAAALPKDMLPIAKPVIAMIHGYCIGGGVMIALDADIRICADDASFGIPAAKLGVGEPYEVTSKLVALVGPGQTAEILYTGRRVQAAEAARIGLVNRVVAKDALEDEVFAMAREIAANAPLSHVAHKQSIQTVLSGSDELRDSVDAAIAACWTSTDFREGTAAFMERRTAQFTGR